MNSWINQISSLLLESPGNLIYHLVLVFVISTSLQFAYIKQKVENAKKPSRLLLGLGILLALQLILFSLSALSWQGMIDPRNVLPPLERAFFAISLIWIIWLWAFPVTQKSADYSTFALTITVLILFAVTLNVWNTQSMQFFFNASWLDWGWNVLSAMVIIGGILLLLLRHPEGWGTALAFLNLNLLGIMAHILWGNQNADFIAPIRLAQICSYPLLPTLTYRISQSLKTSVTEPVHAEKTKQEANSSFEIVKTWARLNHGLDYAKFYEEFSRALAVTLSAQICIPFHKTSGGVIHCFPGYDTYQQKAIEEKELSLEHLPGLRLAIQTGKPERFNLERCNPTEKAVLQGKFSLKDWAGDLLIMPFNSKSDRGVFLLSPYADAALEIPALLLQDASFLKTMDDCLVSFENSRFEQEKSQKSMLQLLDKIQELQNINAALERDLEKIQSSSPVSTNVGELISIQQESQELIQQLQQENADLKQQLVVAAARADLTLSLEKKAVELEEALLKINRLETALAESNRQLLELEKSSARPKPPHASPEKPLVNMNGLIDQVVDELGSQLVERNIALHLDIPSRLPKVEIDSDAFRLALSLLLQKAVHATDKAGKINLMVRLEKTNPFQGSLSVQMRVLDGIGQKTLQSDQMPQDIYIDKTKRELSSLETSSTIIESLGGTFETRPEQTGLVYLISIPVNISPTPLSRKIP